MVIANTYLKNRIEALKGVSFTFPLEIIKLKSSQNIISYFLLAKTNEKEPPLFVNPNPTIPRNDSSK